MKNKSTLLFIGFFTVLLSSCTKVIELDLNETEKKYVLEAVLTDEPGTAKVILTETKNFDEDNTFPGVSGATITITEINGNSTALTETNAGVYEAPALTATLGKNYTLTVSVAGKQFTATCAMPAQKINLDSIYITDELLFTDTRKIVNAVYQDPAGRGNNYRFIQYVNGLKEKQVLIQNDDYTDGRNVVQRLFYFADDDEDQGNIKSGDEVKIEMLCIDPAIYKYWFSLDRSSTGGGNNQATPSNPVSNIQGGALGYFSVHTYQSTTIIAP
jgi:hypothetical protein